MDEVVVTEVLLVVVYAEVGVVGGQSGFALVRFLLVEAKVDALGVVGVDVVEGYFVLFDRGKVLLGFFVGRGAQTFVVLYFVVL